MKNCFHNICIHESHDKKAMCVMSHYQFTYYNNVCQITTFILVCVLFYIIYNNNNNNNNNNCCI